MFDLAFPGRVTMGSPNCRIRRNQVFFFFSSAPFRNSLEESVAEHLLPAAGLRKKQRRSWFVRGLLLAKDSQAGIGCSSSCDKCNSCLAIKLPYRHPEGAVIEQPTAPRVPLLHGCPPVAKTYPIAAPVFPL